MTPPQIATGRRRGPKRQRGFALLMVFALAASVAILFYLEIPRVAFERQRDKEALLIDRGEQYARAIELYSRKTRHYPQTLDDLEHGLTVRFLRRRYKDPMTGKDEWRLIHMGPAGMYTDSKVHKMAGELGSEELGPGVLASKIQGIGQSATVISDGQATSAALQKRASDRIIPGSDPSANPGNSGQGGADPNAPNQQPNITGQPNGAQFPFSNQPGTDSQQPGNAQAPALAFGPPQQGGLNGGNSNQDGSAQTQAGQTIQSILGQRTTQTGNGSGQSGTSGIGGIGGGQPGMTGNQPGMAGGGAALGAGLAGVATTVEMEGIRRYKDHSNYSEWEFLFDPKDAKGQGMGMGNQQNGGFGNGNGGAPGVPFGGMQGGNPAPASGSASSTPHN